MRNSSAHFCAKRACIKAILNSGVYRCSMASKTAFLKRKPIRINLMMPNASAALEKELSRKDKALAETAALLVLKKKVQEIWGDEDDPTAGSNGK